MSINHAELLGLPPAEQLQIVEMLWDKLGGVSSTIPLPEWVENEGLRRFREMNVNPALGTEHQTVWKHIESRNG